MEAESGQLPTFEQRFQSALGNRERSPPLYTYSESTSAYLNESRVDLLRFDKDRLPKRVLSRRTGVLLPITEQPPGTPRPPCSEYKETDKSPRKSDRRHKPKTTKSRKDKAENPALELQQKQLMSMSSSYPEYRDLMVSAKEHVVVAGDKPDGGVAFAAPEVGIQPGSPRAAEIEIPRTGWERVQKKMEKMKRRWKLQQESPKKGLKRKTGMEGLEDLLDEEEDDEGMGNVLPS